MKIKIRALLAYGTTGALVIALYGASIYRVEQLRNAPGLRAGCSHTMCISQNPSFAGLR
jgi:hypothetical protein